MLECQVYILNFEPLCSFKDFRAMKAKEVLQRYSNGERNFQRVNLRGKSFKGADLSGADFSEADIRGTNFREATLTRNKL